MRVTLDLFAADTGELLASAPIAQGAIVNRGQRLIGGLSVPWNVDGMPSTGRTRFEAGSISVPADPTWVKLLVEHNPNAAVGHLRESRDTAPGLLAALRVADGPAGDQALADAENHTRDALSVRVEVDKWRRDGETLVVQASRLREISLVAVPAYESARASVLAALPTTERHDVMTQLSEMLEVVASAPAGQPATPPATTPPAATPPEAPNNAPAVVQAGAGNAPIDWQTLSQLAQVPNLSAVLAALGGQPAAPATPGTVVPVERPAGPAGGAPATGILTVEAAASTFATQIQQGHGLAEVVAALNDVVPANDAGGATAVTPASGRGQWLGELWKAKRSDRPYVDAFGQPKKLTGLKAYGWRWVNRAQVADYAGNKAAIPSNPISTEPAEASAYRVAGGWDVDRVYADLGSSGMIASIFEGATEDYAVKSDSKFGAQLLAGATASIAATTLAGILMEMAAELRGIGARLSFLAMAGDIFDTAATLTKDEIPWWFGNNDTINIGDGSGSIGTFKFWVDPALPAGEFVGGDTRAATFFEEGSTPIRVQAENIPNGGIDLGVFGYNAVIINDARALLKPAA